MWVRKVKGYEDDNEQRAMALLEGYIISAANKCWVEGFDADDVAQELRMHLWRKIHLYNPLIGTIETWGYQVISNRVRDLARRTDPLCNPHCEYDEEQHGTEFFPFV